MATKQQVIKYHEAHPEWGPSEIAAKANCMTAFVRTVGYRNGLTFPDSRKIPQTPQLLLARAKSYEMQAKALRKRAKALKSKK